MRDKIWFEWQQLRLKLIPHTYNKERSYGCWSIIRYLGCSAHFERPIWITIGGSSSGRTTDSDSVNLGSNPSPPASFWIAEIRRHPQNSRKTAIYKAKKVRYALHMFADIQPFLGVKMGVKQKRSNLFTPGIVWNWQPKSLTTHR